MGHPVPRTIFQWAIDVCGLSWDTPHLRAILSGAPILSPNNPGTSSSYNSAGTSGFSYSCLSSLESTLNSPDLFESPRNLSTNFTDVKKSSTLERIGQKRPYEEIAGPSGACGSGKRFFDGSGPSMSSKGSCGSYVNGTNKEFMDYSENASRKSADSSSSKCETVTSNKDPSSTSSCSNSAVSSSSHTSALTYPVISDQASGSNHSSSGSKDEDSSRSKSKSEAGPSAMPTDSAKICESSDNSNSKHSEPNNDPKSMQSKSIHTDPKSSLPYPKPTHSPKSFKSHKGKGKKSSSSDSSSSGSSKHSGAKSVGSKGASYTSSPYTYATLPDFPIGAPLFNDLGQPLWPGKSTLFLFFISRILPQYHTLTNFLKRY